MGLGGTEGAQGYAVHAAIGHSFGRSLVSGWATAVLLPADFLWDDVWDVALLYGRTFGGPEVHFSVGAGLGLAGGSALGESSRSVGLALEAQVFGAIVGPVGLGVYAFGNLNGQRSFGGLTLALRFGRP